MDQMMASDPFFLRFFSHDDDFFGPPPPRRPRYAAAPPALRQQQQQMQQQQVQQPALLPLDISETDGAYLVRADLPGVGRESVAWRCRPTARP